MGCRCTADDNAKVVALQMTSRRSSFTAIHSVCVTSGNDTTTCNGNCDILPIVLIMTYVTAMNIALMPDIIQYHKYWSHSMVSHCAEPRWKGGSILMFRDASCSISLGLQIQGKHKKNTAQIKHKYKTNTARRIVRHCNLYCFALILLFLFLPPPPLTARPDNRLQNWGLS